MSLIKKDSRIILEVEKFNENREEFQKTLGDFLQNNKVVFTDFCKKLEEFRKYFKENGYNEVTYTDKEKEFVEYSHKFNKALDTFLDEIADLEETENIGKSLLEMMTSMQLAQSKNTRIHIRLHKIRMKKSEGKILDYEKKMGVLVKEFDNYKTSIITIMGIFISIFSFITLNISFFKTLGEDTTLIEITKLILLINSVLLVVLITLFNMISVIFMNKKSKWHICFYLIPIIFFLLIYILTVA